MKTTHPKIRKVTNRDSEEWKQEVQKFREDGHKRTEDLTLSVAAESWDSASRTLQLVASTNYPYHYQGWWTDYEEVLEISEEAIDMERFETKSMPLLRDHRNSTEAILGKIIDWKIEKAPTQLPPMASPEEYKQNLDRLIVTAYIDDNEYNNKEIIPKLESGSLSNVSIGYRIKEYEWHEVQDLNTPDRMIAKKWSLMEVSLVGVPADYFAGVRGLDTNAPGPDTLNNKASITEGADPMGDKTKTTEPTTEPNKIPEPTPPVDTDAIRQEERKKERERAALIGQIATETGLDANELINSEKTVEEVRQLGYEAMRKKLTDIKSANVDIGSSGEERKVKDFGDLFLSKISKRTYDEKKIKVEVAKDSEFRNMGLVDAMMRFRGSPWVNRGKFLMEEFQKSRVLGQGSFPQILQDTMNKFLIDVYNERGMVYDGITTTTSQNNLHAFKPKRFDIDGVPEEVKEGEDIPFATAAEEGNQIEIAKYAKAFAVTEEALLNDDLSGFDRIFMYFGRGMVLREVNLITQLLFPAAATFGGSALFSTARNNLVDVGTGGLSLANVKAGRIQMRKQTTPSGKPMDIFPSYIICGEDLAEDAHSFLRATIWPREITQATESVRRGITSVISHPYIDTALGTKSDKDFILAASPADGGVEIVKRVVHNDVRMPEVYSEYNMQKSSMVYFSKFYLGVGLCDYRGLLKVQE